MHFSFLRSWLPLAGLATILCAVVFLVGQQANRSASNDPQIQMAEDAAISLDAGVTPTSVVPDRQIDISRSIAPFLIVEDSSQHAVASSAVINGKIPEIPQGVLEYARQHGEHRVTWQPAPDVRIAAVIVPVSGGTKGFVIAGRSLRETEERVQSLLINVIAGWCAALAGTAVLVAGSAMAL